MRSCSAVGSHSGWGVRPTTTQVTETGQVLNHHLQALGARELDEILEDYVEDSVLIMPDATIKGREGIRAAFEGFLSDLFKPGTYEFALDTRRQEGSHSEKDRFAKISLWPSFRGQLPKWGC